MSAGHKISCVHSILFQGQPVRTTLRVRSAYRGLAEWSEITESKGWWTSALSRHNRDNHTGHPTLGYPGGVRGPRVTIFPKTTRSLKLNLLVGREERITSFWGKTLIQITPSYLIDILSFYASNWQNFFLSRLLSLEIGGITCPDDSMVKKPPANAGDMG